MQSELESGGISLNTWSQMSGIELNPCESISRKVERTSAGWEIQVVEHDCWRGAAPAPTSRSWNLLMPALTWDQPRCNCCSLPAANWGVGTRWLTCSSSRSSCCSHKHLQWGVSLTAPWEEEGRIPATTRHVARQRFLLPWPGPAPPTPPPPHSLTDTFQWRLVSTVEPKTKRIQTGA